MSRFQSVSETVAIDVGEGDTVHIKPYMTYGDHRAISSLFTALGRDERASALAEYQILLLERNIRRWEGPGFSGPDGEPLPVTRELIDALDGDTVELILSKINDCNPQGEQDDPKGSRRARTFSPPSSDTASGSPASTPSSSSVESSAGPGES